MKTNKNTPKTILVTGGAGFIGSNFIRQILSKHPKVKIVNFDKLTYSGNLNNLKDVCNNKRYFFIKGDIANRKQIDAVFSKFKPDFIINFAAETHVDRSIHVGAREFIRTNVEGVLNLLEAIKISPQVKKYVQVSTDEVYGSLSLGSKKKFTENSSLAPNSPYASSKASGDLLVRSFCITYGLPLVITRSSNNYGPYQHPEKLIPYSIWRLVEGNPIAIYGDGKYVRDWIHVEDHCEALILTLMKGIPGEIYNIGAGDEVSNLTLARQLLLCFKKDDSAITFVKDRPGHDRRYAINASKIRRELGWKPKHSFKESFEPTVKWYLEHTDWIKKALARAGGTNTHI